MKIIRASIVGFMGIDRADIRLGHVNVFFGPNGIGKSSVLEGILLPIFGETPRQPKKKDWNYMIRPPAKKAEIYVQVSEKAGADVLQHELEARINPKSNSVRPFKEPDLFDRVLLNPLAFFDLPPKLKADLAGDVKLDPETVHNELHYKYSLGGKVLDETVSIIMEHRLTGAEKVLEQKRLTASRAMQDPGPEPKLFYQGREFDGNVTREKLVEYRDNVAKWAKAAGQVEAQMQSASSVEAEKHRRYQLRNEAQTVLNEVNAPDEFPRQKELDSVSAQHQACIEKADDLTRQLNFDKVRCEVCGQMWSPQAPELARRLDDTNATQRDLYQSLSQLTHEYNEWKARKDQQRWAEERMSQLDQMPELPTIDLNALRAELERTRTGQRQCEEWLQVVERFLTEREMWHRRTQEYERAKSIRAEWDLAVKTVRDPKFKAALVADPLTRARQRLLATGAFFDMKIFVDDQLDVNVNGRPWWLLSNAQKLQASVALADAFAYAGGNKVLVLDGVDTLVGTFQRRLVDFLRAIKDDYDTIMLALALEDEKPVAFEALEQLKDHHGGSYEPLARWFWVHAEESGVTVTFRREL